MEKRNCSSLKSESAHGRSKLEELVIRLSSSVQIAPRSSRHQGADTNPPFWGLFLQWPPISNRLEARHQSKGTLSRFFRPQAAPSQLSPLHIFFLKMMIKSKRIQWKIFLTHLIPRRPSSFFWTPLTPAPQTARNPLTRSTITLCPISPSHMGFHRSWPQGSVACLRPPFNCLFNSQ